MRAVSTPIREGAEGFLKVQYTAIARIAVILSILITLSYFLRPSSKMAHGVGKLGNGLLGILASCSFVMVGELKLGGIGKRLLFLCMKCRALPLFLNPSSDSPLHDTHRGLSVQLVQVI